MLIIKDSFPKGEILGDDTDDPWKKPCRDIRIISLDTEHLSPDRFIHEGDLILIGAGSHGRMEKILAWNKNSAAKT